MIVRIRQAFPQFVQVFLPLFLPFLLPKLEKTMWEWMKGRGIGPQSWNERPILGAGETGFINFMTCLAFFWSVRHELKAGEMVILWSPDMIVRNVAGVIFIETFYTFLKRSAGVPIDQ